MPKEPFWTDAEIVQLADLRKRGLRLAQIAALMGRPERGLKAKLARLGIVLDTEQRRAVNQYAGMIRGQCSTRPKYGTGARAGELVQQDHVRNATVRLELAYRAAAARNGWAVHKYEAGA
jgi:hypothetical protein